MKEQTLSSGLIKALEIYNEKNNSDIIEVINELIKYFVYFVFFSFLSKIFLLKIIYVLNQIFLYYSLDMVQIKIISSTQKTTK